MFKIKTLGSSEHYRNYKRRISRELSRDYIILKGQVTLTYNDIFIIFPLKRLV